MAALLNEGVWQQQTVPAGTAHQAITISYGDYSFRLIAPVGGGETPAFRSIREFIEQIGGTVRR